MLLLSERTLRACRLNRREAVVCAFSGGPDSTALLLELKRLRDEGAIGPLYAAHFEHGIRGEEARADLDFCRKLCLDLGVPLFSESADVPAYAKGEGLSLETAARQLRYAFLRRLRTALGAAVIALGHHRDDQAETVLLHLVRGSGRKGLTGMAPRNGDLVRPLLFVGKDDVLTYLTERGQAYRLDSTNALADASRNLLRQAGMAALTAVNARAAEHIAACADRLRAEDEYLDELARQALIDADGSRSALAKLPPVLRDRAALLLLRSVTDDFTEADVDRLLELFCQPSGRTVSLRGNLIARAEGDRIAIGPSAKSSHPLSGPRGVSGRGQDHRAAHAAAGPGGGTVRAPGHGGEQAPLGLLHGSEAVRAGPADASRVRRRGAAVRPRRHGGGQGEDRRRDQENSTYHLYEGGRKP